MKKIAIYNGKGASPTGANLLKRAFSEALHDFGMRVQFLSDEDLNQKGYGWRDAYEALIIGGGAFGEMKAAVDPAALRAVHDFAQEKICIGICMGAYGLSSAIEFVGEDISKVSDGMRVFNGVAKGSLPVTPVLYNGNSNSSRIVTLKHALRDIEFPSLYWGGPAFTAGKEQYDRRVTPLVTLSTPQTADPLVMGLRVDHTAGGRSLLLGYHSEAIRPRDLSGWLERFKSDDEDMQRLHQEIAAHPKGAYYMGFATLLDDSGLVPHHSFVGNVMTPSRRDIIVPITASSP